jgi:aminopeptidase
MSNRPAGAALAAALVLALGACQREEVETATPGPAAAAADAADGGASPGAAYTDLEQLAQRVVTQSAAVANGDVVLISGRLQDAELMENIAVHVAKVGGHPLITYSSDRLAKRLFFDVPPEYDSREDALDKGLVELADVMITLGNTTSDRLFEGADPERVAARGQAATTIAATVMKNNIRRVEIGNNLYPTAWRAERFAMGQDALARMFWNGINLDYTDLQARGEQVKAALAGGNEVHITHPNGTDLRMRIDGRPVLVSDGVISAEDVARGGAATAVYLPAGEVYTTPVPGSAEGTLVHTRTWYRGKQVDALTFTIAGGRVTAMSGSGPGYAALKAEYDAVSDPRKDEFGFVDLGINPQISLPSGSQMGNWVQAGTVTVGTGSNEWAGGDNAVPYSQTVYLPGGTVTLDGETVVEGGVLKL